MELEKKWLVFYTKSRSEKKTVSLLIRHGYEVYLPLITVLRQWSDRKKKIEVPLFNSYIFIKIHESELQEVLQTPGLSWNIRHNGKPAILQTSELETIKRFIATGMLLESQSAQDITVGERVEVIDGPLRGAVGVLAGEYNDQKFSVLLSTLDQVLRLDVDKSLLKKIE